MKTPVKEIEESLKIVDLPDLHPSLEEVAARDGLNRAKLTVALRLENDSPVIGNRHEILITDNSKAAIWMVPTIQSIFRGDKKVDRFGKIPPPLYQPLFLFVELHIVTFCDAFGDKTDGQFEDAFSQLRRRPDGRVVSELQTWLWQVAVTLAGTRLLSSSEFEEIFGRLARSASTFKRGPVSRNYISVLRDL